MSAQGNGGTLAKHQSLTSQKDDEENDGGEMEGRKDGGERRDKHVFYASRRTWWLELTLTSRMIFSCAMLLNVGSFSMLKARYHCNAV